VFPLLVLVVGVVLMVAVATAILAWDFGRTAPGEAVSGLIGAIAGGLIGATASIATQLAGQWLRADLDERAAQARPASELTATTYACKVRPRGIERALLGGDSGMIGDEFRLLGERLEA